MVAHPSIKDFLLNRDLNTKRADWITKAMKYDIEIKVTTLVRGKSLCEQLAEKGNNGLNEDFDAILALTVDKQPVVPNIQNDWVDDMVTFLQIGYCPEGLDRAK